MTHSKLSYGTRETRSFATLLHWQPQQGQFSKLAVFQFPAKTRRHFNVFDAEERLRQDFNVLKAKSLYLPVR